MTDNLTAKQRSRCMSRVRSKNTGLEMVVMRELRKRKLSFRTQARKLPGKPDIVFSSWRVAVFVDGDFWHGFRFPQWKRSQSLFWKKKIEQNRKRDRRNFAKLRRMGWKVIRIWQHTIRKDLNSSINRIQEALNKSS